MKPESSEILKISGVLRVRHCLIALDKANISHRKLLGCHPFFSGKQNGRYRRRVTALQALPRQAAKYLCEIVRQPILAPEI